MEAWKPGQTCRWRLKEVKEDARKDVVARADPGARDLEIGLKSVSRAPAQLQPIKLV